MGSILWSQPWKKTELWPEPLSLQFRQNHNAGLNILMVNPYSTSCHRSRDLVTSCSWPAGPAECAPLLLPSVWALKMVRWLKTESPNVETLVQISARTGLQVRVTQPGFCVCLSNTSKQTKPKTSNKPTKTWTQKQKVLKQTNKNLNSKAKGPKTNQQKPELKSKRS